MALGWVLWRFKDKQVMLPPFKGPEFAGGWALGPEAYEPSQRLCPPPTCFFPGCLSVNSPTIHQLLRSEITLGSSTVLDNL